MTRNIPLASAGHGHHGAAGPTGMLREEHEVILRALALLERFSQRIEAGEPVDREGLAWLRDFFSTFADRCHHGKEEQHLFPALHRYGVPREGGPLGVMLHEHEEGRGLLRAMAQGDDRETATAIRRYAALLRGHIDKENGVLFPLAEQLLPDDEQRRLAHAFEAVEQEVAGAGVHERLLCRLAELEREVATG
ncbi:MAG: hemerythrin domain-containing protein [Candidatus Rokubacteria bacterium]|nr:hemerythrin domain-containing protein [Candidatus Rokubacteria bacterium]